MVDAYLLEVAGERYALDRQFVEGVAQREDLVALPRSPDVLLGAAYWRGAFIPAVDTARLLGLTEPAGAQMLLMLSQGERAVALAVDAARGSAARVTPPAGPAAGMARGLVPLGDDASAEEAIWIDVPQLLAEVGQALGGGGHRGEPR